MAWFIFFGLAYPSHDAFHFHGAAETALERLPSGLAGAVGMVRSCHPAHALEQHLTFIPTPKRQPAAPMHPQRNMQPVQACRGLAVAWGSNQNICTLCAGVQLDVHAVLCRGRDVGRRRAQPALLGPGQRDDQHPVRATPLPSCVPACLAPLHVMRCRAMASSRQCGLRAQGGARAVPIVRHRRQHWADGVRQGAVQLLRLRGRPPVLPRSAAGVQHLAAAGPSSLRHLCPLQDAGHKEKEPAHKRLLERCALQ